MTSLRRSARPASRSRSIPQCATGGCPLRGLGRPRRDRPKMIDPDDTCRGCHERQHALQASGRSSARSVGSGSQSASRLRVGLGGISDRSACVAALVFSEPCSITPSASPPTTNPRSSCSSRSAARPAAPLRRQCSPARPSPMRRCGTAFAQPSRDPPRPPPVSTGSKVNPNVTRLDAP
jgi:hypothetical protein